MARKTRSWERKYSLAHVLKITMCWLTSNKERLFSKCCKTVKKAYLLNGSEMLLCSSCVVYYKHVCSLAWGDHVLRVRTSIAKCCLINFQNRQKEILQNQCRTTECGSEPVSMVIHVAHVTGFILLVITDITSCHHKITLLLLIQGHIQNIISATF